MKRAVLAIVFLSLAASAARSEEPARKWKDAAELSYVSTTGNSKASTLSASNLFTSSLKIFGLEVGAGVLTSDSKGVQTAEQYYANEKVSGKIWEWLYAYEKVGWDKNRFAALYGRYDFSGGLGAKVLDKPKDKLNLEAGGGWVEEDRIHVKNTDYGSGRAYAKYVRTLSDTATVSQEVEYLANFKDPNAWRMNAQTALVASITTHFSLKAAYSWKMSNLPPAGVRKVDELTSVAIIFNF